MFRGSDGCAHLKGGEGRRPRMGLPCSTMPAVVPATALTEAGAVVCRPTERERDMRRRRFSLKGNKLGSPFSFSLQPHQLTPTVPSHIKHFHFKQRNSEKVGGKKGKKTHISAYTVRIFS